jgi:hypothetical protein
MGLGTSLGLFIFFTSQVLGPFSLINTGARLPLPYKNIPSLLIRRKKEIYGLHIIQKGLYQEEYREELKEEIFYIRGLSPYLGLAGFTAVTD